MRFFLIFFFVSFLSCKNKSPHVVLLFDRVDGLQVGAPVKCRGLEIGVVEYMDLHANQVLVKLKLEKEYQIPVGSKFTIYPSLIGGNYIKLELANNKTDFINFNDTLHEVFSEELFKSSPAQDSVMRQEAAEFTGAVIKVITGIKGDSLKIADSLTKR